MHTLDVLLLFVNKQHIEHILNALPFPYIMKFFLWQTPHCRSGTCAHCSQSLSLTMRQEHQRENNTQRHVRERPRSTRGCERPGVGVRGLTEREKKIQRGRERNRERERERERQTTVCSWKESLYCANTTVVMIKMHCRILCSTLNQWNGKFSFTFPHYKSPFVTLLVVNASLNEVQVTFDKWHNINIATLIVMAWHCWLVIGLWILILICTIIGTNPKFKITITFWTVFLHCALIKSVMSESLASICWIEYLF